MMRAVSSSLLRYRDAPYMWILITCLIATPLVFATILEPKVEGDGHEYALQLWALAAHLSPEIRVNDVVDLLSYVQQHKVSGYRNQYLDSLWPQLEEKIGSGLEVRGAIRKTASGSYYGIHFWFYSALCVPAKWLLHAFQGNELKAFQLTNALLLILGLIYLLFLCTLSNVVRIAASLLLFGIGTPYYLLWPHPEIFVAISCLIASAAFLEGRLYLATFAAGLGALQNLTVGLMIPVVFVSQLDRWFNLSVRGKLQSLSLFLLAGSASWGSIIFFLAKFGTPSLIASDGYLDAQYIDWSRLYSFLFDLNQGMIVGIPWIMGLAGLAVAFRVSRVLKSNHETKIPLLVREDWLLVAMFLMAINVLQQVNWNAGQAVYIRYAIWISIPLALWTICQISLVKLGRFCLALAIAGQLLTVYSFGAFSRVDEESQYLGHKRIAVAVLRYAPWAYNPEPEIFVERTVNREVKFPGWRESVVFIPYNQGSVMKKILVHKSKLHTLSAEICGSSQELMTERGDRLQQSMYTETRFDFMYLSGSFLCFSDSTSQARNSPVAVSP